MLFGGLGVWAVVEMKLLDRRDGEWEKPEPVPWSRDVVVVAIATAVFLGVRLAHPWIAGVSAAY